MSATITPVIAPDTPDTTTRETLVYGTIALTGNYGGAATHGDTLNLQQLGDLLKSSQLPRQIEIYEQPPAGTAPSFYSFTYCPGTTQLNGVLTINLAGVEYTQASAYSAALLAAKIGFCAWFPNY